MRGRITVMQSSGGHGAGLEANIVQGYQFLVETYEPVTRFCLGIQPGCIYSA